MTKYAKENDQLRRAALKTLKEADLLGKQAPLYCVDDLSAPIVLPENDITIYPVNHLIYKNASSADVRSWVVRMLPKVDFAGLGLVIAGDAVERLLRENASELHADIDLFLVGHSPESALAAVRQLWSLFAPHARTVRRTRRVLSISLKPAPGQGFAGQANIILRRFPSAQAVLASFDLGPSAFLFDGRRVWTDARGAFSWASGAMVLDLARRRPGLERILSKYFYRGYSLILPSLRDGMPYIALPFLVLSRVYQYHILRYPDYVKNRLSSCLERSITHDPLDPYYEIYRSRTVAEWVFDTARLHDQHKGKIPADNIELITGAELVTDIAAISVNLPWVCKYLGMCRKTESLYSITIDLAYIKHGSPEWVEYHRQKMSSAPDYSRLYALLTRGVATVSLPPLFADEPKVFFPRARVAPAEWYGPSYCRGEAAAQYGVRVEHKAARRACRAVGPLLSAEAGGTSLPLLVLRCFLLEEARINELNFWSNL